MRAALKLHGVHRSSCYMKAALPAAGSTAGRAGLLHLVCSHSSGAWSRRWCLHSAPAATQQIGTGTP